jgi:single-strand DNA-binding protein
MSSFNKVYLVGNLTCDPELRTLPSGSSVVAFGLAVNRSYRKPDGEEVEETTFVDIDAFGKSAETIEKYCKKGDPLMVEGRLRFRSWEDESGQKRNKLNVVLETFQFLPRGESDGTNGDGVRREKRKDPDPF